MENKDIGISDFEIVCRICLDKKKNMTSMFEKSLLPNLIKTYREMLEDCASVHVCYKLNKYKIIYLRSECRLQVVEIIFLRKIIVVIFH